MSPRRIRRIFLIAGAVVVGACAGRTPTPTHLARAFDQAVERGDAAAAYALLAPEVRDHTDFDAFATRFRELADAFRDARARLDDGDRVALTEITTAHPSGMLLDWVTDGTTTYLLAGLPALPRTDTPVAAIRSFVAVLRAGVAPDLGAVATGDLMGRLERDWEQRAARIEAALADPTNLSVSADGGRAIFRYGDGGAIRLVRTPAGWRVDAFE